MRRSRRLLVSVRADTSVFARDVAAMRAELDGPFAAGVEQAGRALENALVRALRTGQARLRGSEAGRAVGAWPRSPRPRSASGLGACSAAAGGGGIGGADRAACSRAFAGAPGKAIGGPVSPGRAYLVGERGPELFVPTASGRIETGRPAGAARDPAQHQRQRAGGGGGAGAAGRRAGRWRGRCRQALLRVED